MYFQGYSIEEQPYENFFSDKWLEEDEKDGNTTKTLTYNILNIYRNI